MKEIHVKYIGDDFFDRHLYQNLETKEVYVDVMSPGGTRGRLHVRTKDGEPIAPIREDIEFVYHSYGEL